MKQNVKSKTTKKVSLKSLEKKLWKACSDYIRNRDSFSQEVVRGTCISCGEMCEGKYAHAGHFLPSKACGLLTRYHPINIHLQCYKCNVPRSRSVIERVKVYYTLEMLRIYSYSDVSRLIELSEIKVNTSERFYRDLTDLYKCADTEKILDYLENYCYNHPDDVRDNNIAELKITDRRLKTTNKKGTRPRLKLRLSKKTKKESGK